MDQRIGYATSNDGTRIAYAVSGTGPLLVRPATFVTHLEADIDGPTWGHWWRELSRDHTLIRYDLRGTGLSQRTTPALSLDAFVDDLEAVVACVGVTSFDVLGHSLGASVALMYAAQHPSHVDRLVIFNGFISGPLDSHLGTKDSGTAQARRALMLQAWDQPWARRLWASWLIPDSTSAELDAAATLLHKCATATQAAGVSNGGAKVGLYHTGRGDWEPQALVLHSRANEMVPMAAGKAIAESIPGARFVELESSIIFSRSQSLRGACSSRRSEISCRGRIRGSGDHGLISLEPQTTACLPVRHKSLS